MGMLSARGSHSCNPARRPGLCRPPPALSSRRPPRIAGIPPAATVARTARRYSSLTASICTMPALITRRTSSPAHRPALVGGPAELVQVAPDRGQLAPHPEEFEQPIVEVIRPAGEGFPDEAANDPARGLADSQRLIPVRPAHSSSRSRTTGHPRPHLGGFVFGLGIWSPSSKIRRKPGGEAGFYPPLGGQDGAIWRTRNPLWGFCLNKMRILPHIKNKGKILHSKKGGKRRINGAN